LARHRRPDRNPRLAKGARALFERALAVAEKLVDPAHPSTAAKLNNLALVLKAQGDLAGAAVLHGPLTIRKSSILPHAHVFVDRAARALDRVGALGYLPVVTRSRAVDRATTACFAGKPAPYFPHPAG
jgi:hypothetical protein